MATLRTGSLIGELLPDFSLPASEGGRRRLSDYRGRRNLVIILAGRVSSVRGDGYLSEIARRYADLAGEEAEVLGFTVGTYAEANLLKREQALPFPVLPDDDGRFHHALGACDDEGKIVAAVLVTDRYGEVFGVWRSAEGRTPPTVDEILDWLCFINLHCPECGVSHWRP